MPILQVPDSWTAATGGIRTAYVSGATARQALIELTSRHSELHRRIFSPDGRIGGWIAVYIGDEKADPDVPIDDAAVLTVLPALAGG